jgi:hypothetical protein
MKIELVKEIVPIPKKSTGRRDTPEGKADRSMTEPAKED